MAKPLTFWQRLAPAFALLLMAPLVAEFLLADFNIRQIGMLAIFAPLYGGGALVIREFTRRAGRGWHTMVLLAIAWGFCLEGFVNQTLFNPDYAGAHLLKYGFLPSLGTSLNYTVFIVSLHTIWSTCTPIALAESLAGERHNTPWLRRPELIGAVTLWLLGTVATGMSSFERFKYIASFSQFATVAAIIGTLVLIAFVATPHMAAAKASDAGPAGRSQAPSLLVVLLVAFAITTAFQIWFHYAPGQKIAPLLGLTGFVAIDLAAFAALRLWSERAGWGPEYPLAAAVGAILTYGWFGMRRYLDSGATALGVPTTPVDIAGQGALLLGFLGLGYVGYKRLARRPSPSPAPQAEPIPRAPGKALDWQR